MQEAYALASKSAQQSSTKGGETKSNGRTSKPMHSNRVKKATMTRQRRQDNQLVKR